MYFTSVNEKQAVDFTNKLLKYYKNIDSGSINKVYTSSDIESQRNNVGWYRHEVNQHKIFINIPNIMYAKSAIDSGIIDYDGFYAFLTLCTGHEFRHFLQGRVIYDGQEIDGFNQKDVLNSELMLYIRYFFDAYYLLNKGYIKYEVDAEKFSVINGIRYLQDTYPDMDSEKAMLAAVNFYANIQSQGGIASTLPCGCESIAEIIEELTNKIKYNKRVPNLDRTLFVYNPNFYATHERFDLNEDRVLTNELLCKYYNEEAGSKRDLLVVKKILSLLEHPEESLEEFPQLKKQYKAKTL